MAQGVVPTLDVRPLPAVLAAGRVLLGGEHLLVGLPKVAVTMRPAVGRRDLPPELATSFSAAVTKHVSYQLARAAAERDPHTTLAALLTHERPELIEFERADRAIIRP